MEKLDSKPKYHEGQRVKLRQLGPEDGYDDQVPQEVGTILGVDWTGPHNDGCYMYVTQVDLEFWSKEMTDDGLREHGEEDIVEVLAK